MRFARWAFTAAGIYGLVVLTPFLFLERQVAAPAAGLVHPEYFYGFLVVAIACQLLFLLIGRDPARLRPAMIAAVLEKLPFGLLVPVLWMQGRVQTPVVMLSSLDLVWGTLFIVAWLTTPKT
jgi:hypothetical protein